MKVILLWNVVGLLLLTAGCKRSSGEVWDDTKTAGRYAGKGFKSMFGKHGDSRQVISESQFSRGNHQDDFVPLKDGDSADSFAMGDLNAFEQPRHSPGDPGSSIPGVDAFIDPANDPQLAKIFERIHFAYNSSMVKSDMTSRARTIASYMRSHPNVYLFVEGHCDERGPQAYNLALGSRRSNSVRNFLISEGVNPDNVFTVSYGKERPIIQEHNERAWSMNRRAEFKVFRR